ncbi:hypothetical protein BURKHO8Y_530001 [Burkholderia sp. 8Y]|nr:hypothetical protein BURKHO8Y_530001 [Burkholderia sp. 8Y]
MRLNASYASRNGQVHRLARAFERRLGYRARPSENHAL